MQSGQTRTRANRGHIQHHVGSKPGADAKPASDRARRDRHGVSALQPADLGLGELFVHTREAVIVGHLDSGTIALWNPAAERIFGYSAAEAIGRPIDMLIPPAIARLHNAALAHYRRGGDGSFIGSNTPLEVPALTKSGEEIRVELSLVPLRNPGARGRFVLAMLHDTADRRRAELQALESARARAARTEAEAALTAFHELVHVGLQKLERPVRRLQRASARLARAIPSSGSADRAAQLALVVEQRAEAVRQATQQLTDRAALESGHVELEPQRVNLVPLLGQIVATARARGTGHRLTLAMPQGLTVVVDPRRIEQILTELIDLAIRRSPRGSWIDVELRRPLAGLARFEVRDYGQPIALSERERLLDRAGPEPVLFVHRSLLERHSGTLTAEHPADGGLRLVATLPAQRGLR